ncbi:MAG: hypothetical protein DME07_20940 [Candidatus Rokuibacteriota bacterium]|nr:MAG: hypothetical protein DME07_20940 [Candidatus Rokubacteria bacterium]
MIWKSRSLPGAVARETEAIAGGSLIGLRLKGRYRIVGEIGAGVGRVCQAEDDATGHRIAVRVLPKALIGTSNGTPTLQRMSRSVIAVSAAHSGLASVLAFGESEQGWPFAVMELVEGRRLSDVLAEGGQLDAAVAMRWALDLGGAVETLHNMGLVHGAVRPRNVAVLADGSAKLLDVELAGLRDLPGLASASGRETPPEYLAPEHARGASLTEKADIYAFAVVLYEMLTGARPFRAASREAVRDPQATQTPTPMRSRRRTVPASVDAVVAMALATEPDERPHMQELLNRLWSEANGPARSRRRRVAIIASASLAASVVGLGTWAFVAWRASTLAPTHQVARPKLVIPAAPPVQVVPAPVRPTEFPRPAPVAAPPAPAPAAESPRPAPVAAPPEPARPAESPRPTPVGPAPARPVESPRPAPVAAPPAPARPVEALRPAPVAAPPASARPVESPRPAPVAAPPAPARPVESPRPAAVVTPSAPARPVESPRPAPVAAPPASARPAPVVAAPPETPAAATPAPARTPAVVPERPAPSRQSGPDDPGAVIDWLLNPSRRE